MLGGQPSGERATFASAIAVSTYTQTHLHILIHTHLHHTYVCFIEN